MIESAALTLIAAGWRYLDGRGIPQLTAARNVIGIALALICAFVGLGMTWQAGIAGGLAALTLIAGFTDWPSLWSLARYGGPTCAIAVVGYLGGGPGLSCALYAAAGVLVGVVYVALHRLGWGLATAASEVIAGGAIVGGLAWL